MKTKLLTFLALTAFMLCANVFKAQAILSIYGYDITVSDLTDTSVKLTFKVKTEYMFKISKLTFTVGESSNTFTTTAITSTQEGATMVNVGSVIATGLTPYRTYTVKVDMIGAYNGIDVDNNTRSFTDLFTTTDTKPPTIANKVLTINKVDKTSVRLSWESATDESTSGAVDKRLKYTVNWKKTSGGSWLKEEAGHNGCTITGLEEATKYTIRVDVQDVAGNVSSYNEVEVTTTGSTDKTPPTVPNKTITVGAITNTSVAISWNKATDDVTSQSNLTYVWSWAKASAPLSPLGVHSGKNVYSFTYTDLEPNTKYDFWVYVMDAAGNGTDYTRVSATTTGAAATVPNVVTYNVSNITNTSFYVDGYPKSDGGASITEWAFFYRKAGETDSGTKFAATYNGSFAIATITGLQSGTAYQVRIGAKNSAGWGYGDWLPVTTTGAATDTQAPTVTNKTITASDVSATSVKLTWNAASDNVTAGSKLKYKVYYCIGGAMSDVPTMEANADGNSGILTGITTYTYTLDLQYPHSINIVVEDEAGNKTAYNDITVKYTATVAVTGVSLNKSTLSLEEGKSETLTATVAPATATNKNVTWKSSNTAVATVDAAGKVTAVKAGTATITATTTDGGKIATCAVTVTAATTPPKINSANNTSVVNGKGGTFTATATGTAPFTWSLASQPAGVSINASTGVMTIAATVAVGTYTFSLKVDGAIGHDLQSFTLTVTSGVVNVTGVSLDQTMLSLKEGETEALTATVAPATATNKDVTWESSNTAVATVDVFGVVTAVKAGSATITVTTKDGGKSATCTVTVSDTPVSIEQVTDEQINAYIVADVLYVTSPKAERIDLYSLTGVRLYSAEKSNGEIQIRLNNTSRGFLIVRGSSGWSKKLIRK